MRVTCWPSTSSRAAATLKLAAREVPSGRSRGRSCRGFKVPTRVDQEKAETERTRVMPEAHADPLNSRRNSAYYYAFHHMWVCRGMRRALEDTERGSLHEVDFRAGRTTAVGLR